MGSARRWNMRTRSIAIATMMVLLMGCATRVPYQGSPFIKWEHDGAIHSFDKASAYTATFLAKHISENSTVLEFQGKQLEFQSLGPVQDNTDIESYKVRIPGPLGEGLYTINAQQTIGTLTAQDKLTLRVFPSRLITGTLQSGEEISNEEEIKGLITSLSKGDVMEFDAIPSSGLFIPEQQFKTIVKGLKNDITLIGTNVHYTDEYTIPIETDKIGVKIIWQDPLDQQVQVQVFPSDGTEFVESMPGIKRPRIVCSDISRIINEHDPVFHISIEVKAPIYLDMTTTIENVKIDVIEHNVNGYNIVPIDSPKLINGTWVMSFKLAGTLPIIRGTGGSIKIKCKATAKSTNGEISPEAVKTCRFNVVY